MYGTYTRLNVNVWATNREVIKASRGKLNKKVWGKFEFRENRKAFYKLMLKYHKDQQKLCKKWRL